MAEGVTKASLVIFLSFTCFSWVFCEELLEKDECLSFPLDLKTHQVYQEISYYIKLIPKSEKILFLMKFSSYLGFISIIALVNKLAGLICDKLAAGVILKPLFMIFSGTCVFFYVYCSKITNSQYCPTNILQVILQEEFTEIVSEEMIELVKEFSFPNEIIEICAFLGMIVLSSAGLLALHRTVKSQIKILGYLVILLVLWGFFSFADMFKLYSEYRVYLMA
jgi:hypothetical protein